MASVTHLTNQSQFVQSNATIAGTNISGTIASNGISLSVASPSGGGAALQGSGTYTQNTGTIQFANSNGITFGLSNNGVMTASYNSTQFQSTGNYLTTAAQSNQVVNSLNGSTGQISLNVGSSLSASTNGSSITFGLASNITTALQSANANYLTSQSGQAFSASGGSSSFQTLNFANSNGITFSNSNGSVIASHNGLTTARASTDAIGLNTAVSNVTATINSSGLSLDARGYAGTGTTFNGANVSGSMTVNSNGVNLSLSAGAGGGVTPAASGSNGSFSFSTLSFGNLNGLSFYTSNGSIVGSYTDAGAGAGISAVVISAGTTNGAVSNFSFANSNGISFGLNGSTITASNEVPPLFAYANNLYMFNSQTIQPRQSTSAVFPVNIPNNLSFDHMRFPMTVSMGSTTLGTTANTTLSAGVTYTFNVGFYRTGTANATSLSSYITTNAGLSQSINLGANANGSQYTVSIGLTYPQNGTGAAATATFSTSYNVSTSNFAISTTGLTAFTGMKHFEIPFVSSLPDDMYWVNLGVSSSVQTQGIAGLSSPLVLHSFWAMSQPNNTWGFFGNANNATVQNISGIGSFSTAGGGTVAGFGFSKISSSASHNVPYIYMEFDGL